MLNRIWRNPGTGLLGYGICRRLRSAHEVNINGGIFPSPATSHTWASERNTMGMVVA
jgi:hypothetical protein